MKKNQLFYILFAIVGGIVFACSGEESEKAAKNEFKDVEALPGEDTTAREQDEFNKLANVYSKNNYKKFQAVKRKFKNVLHFSVTKSGLLFLRQSKENAFSANGKYDDKIRFALLDETGKELLPMTCEQISNPGFTAKDYIEYKADGKFGLFNYVKNEKIDAKYDVIYPSRIMEYVAIGERDGKIYKIYNNGKEKALTSDENPPNYYNLLKEFRYNYKSEFYGWWYDTDDFEYKMEEEGDYPMSYGMIMPPSYIAKLDVLPNLVSHIFIEGDSTNLEPLKQVKRNDNITSITSSFYQYFGDARGYMENSMRLTTIGKNNKVKQTVVLYAYDDYSMPDNSKDSPKAVFLNDSLIEVKNFLYKNEEQEYLSFMPYDKYTKYEYYSIEANGKIVPVGQGNYPMISAILLSRAHFKGTFSRYLSEFETIEKGYNPDEVGSNIQLTTDHLSAADMQFMINELYAYKGMKFTDPDLVNYFSQFNWYKPKYKNVESKLTETEKKNVKMIKNLIKDVNSNPSKFIHEDTGISVEAG